jgi:hypothetical protein
VGLGTRVDTAKEGDDVNINTAMLKIKSRADFFKENPPAQN